MQETTQGDAVALIETRLRRGELYFTLPEAAAMTGLSIDETRHAMEDLLNKYICRLQVSENGDLIYYFGEALQRRGEKTMAERCREFFNWLWRVFTVIYKSWIAVTLVAYFVVFLVIVLAVIVATSFQDDRRGGGRSMPLGTLFDLFFSIFYWRSVTGTMTDPRGLPGRRARHDEPRSSEINAKQKNLITAVYDFVFGPPSMTPDPLSNAREVAAYLQQNNGIVVTAELCALAGWTLPQAEIFLTDCILRYQGEGKISDDPVLYGQFDELMRGVSEVESGEIVYYWDEDEPNYEMNGNRPSQNVIICVMNGFNLIVSFAIVRGGLSAVSARVVSRGVLAGLAKAAWVNVVFGVMPLTFSILFFGIPLARWFRNRTLKQRRQKETIRKRLFKAIFARQGRAQTVDDVTAAVNRRSREAVLSPPEVEAALKELALDMPGDMEVSEEAKLQFAFPRITSELTVVERLRRHRRGDDSLGTIVIESDNR